MKSPTLAARWPKARQTASHSPSISSMSNQPISAWLAPDSGIDFASGVAMIAHAGEFELP